MPDRYFTKLRYYDIDTPQINLSANYAYNYYNMNGLYDINPAILSSVVPGTITFTNTYRSYRVRAAKITFEVANIMDQPLLMTLHQQTDYSPSTFITWATIVSFEGNKYTKQRVIAGSEGMNKGKLSLFVNFSKINGNKLQYMTDADYTGTLSYTIPTVPVAGSNPNNIFAAYCILSTVDGAPVPTPAPVPVRVVITQYVEFFRRVDTYL